VGNIFKLKHLTCKHEEGCGYTNRNPHDCPFAYSFSCAFRTTTFSRIHSPLASPNETPGLFYVRYFTNASRVLVLFENRENAEKFASLIRNNSVVITSDGTHADVLMKGERFSQRY